VEHFIRCVERLGAIQSHGQHAVAASLKGDVLISVVGGYLAVPILYGAMSLMMPHIRISY